MDERVAAEDARTTMVGWLVGPEAATAARRELRRYGLDAYDPSDLVNDVVVSVLQADFDAVVGNPVGYVRRALTNRARDLLSGERVRWKRPVAPPVPNDDGDGPADEAVSSLEDVAALDPAAVVAAGAAEDEVRRRLFRQLPAARAWAVAAALATLTLRLHDDVAVPDGAPAPAAGPRSGAARWAALWLAGETAAFADPDGGVETAAIRKTRSRRLQEVDALLAAAASGLVGGDVDA